MTAVHAPDLVSEDLVALSHALGEPGRDLVILAEGNTSRTLPDGRVVVKASGSNLASVTAEDFVVVDTGPLIELAKDPASTQTALTEALDAGEVGGKRRRGSIEALVHVVMHALKPEGSPELYVGHTHPTDVVGLLASVHAATAWEDWVYSDEAVVIGRPLYVPYASPGIDLGRLYYEAVAQRVAETGELPQLVLLGNHGIVATAPTAGGVEGISAMAVKGARVRASAYAVGGVAPLSRASVEKFFARDDIAERRGNLAESRF
ncbi:class II aldolase [Nakamurella sp. YIM 132087]|uniref:Class II aldolase n=1 Tax=Nakamurella alba TaxID=2665158 RepID=A0A7K1FN15_9ACTN|nr:class II aldolase/adducin family protein [Nakamurella alba]MTD15518.1 class II aldolase [Nakamurella alba]